MWKKRGSSGVKGLNIDGGRGGKVEGVVGGLIETVDEEKHYRKPLVSKLISKFKFKWKSWNGITLYGRQCHSQKVRIIK